MLSRLSCRVRKWQHSTIKLLSCNFPHNQLAFRQLHLVHDSQMLVHTVFSHSFTQNTQRFVSSLETVWLQWVQIRAGDFWSTLFVEVLICCHLFVTFGCASIIPSWGQGAMLSRRLPIFSVVWNYIAPCWLLPLTSFQATTGWQNNGPIRRCPLSSQITTAIRTQNCFAFLRSTLLER